MVAGAYPHLKPGQLVISATKWNYLVEKVRQHETRQATTDATLQLLQQASGGLAAKRFIVEDASDHPDTIRCLEYEGTTGTLHVARPYLLRRTPFDANIRNNLSYDYTSNTERIARKADVDGNETTETQIIIPRYVQGDVIYAVRGVANGTEAYVLVLGQSYPEPDATVEVSWIDLNVDGRYWARKAGDA